MGGSVKLKIKLKPRPTEAQPSSESSGLKRKFHGLDSDRSREKVDSTQANNQSHKPKKLKLVRNDSATPAAASLGSKVKLHIKGPWDKATNYAGNANSPHTSSVSAAQPAFSQQRPSQFIGSRPPVKQGPSSAVLLHSIKPPSKKKKQYTPSATGNQPFTASQANGLSKLGKHGPQALDTKSEDTNLDSVSGHPGTTLGHAMKVEEASTSGPVTHPTRTILERIVDKMQRKDTFNIFKEPVTEAMVRMVCIATHNVGLTHTFTSLQAPGYFSVVKRGMDFLTMRAKVQANEYSIWQDFQV